MTTEEILAEVAQLERWFMDEHIPKANGINRDRRGLPKNALLMFCHAECDKVRGAIAEGKLHKAIIKLGKIYGCLVGAGEFSWNQTKNEFFNPEKGVDPHIAETARALRK